MINLVAEKVPTPKGKLEMQWKKLIEPTVWAVWGLIVGGAGLWVIVGSIGFFVKEGWLPNDTSGWVQAIGSIGAILVAIWISGGERRHKEKIEKAASRDALARAIDASEHARTTAQNCVVFFSSNYVQRGEMPRHLAVVEHAAIRVKEISAGPGMDSELLGHLYEVSNSLVDVRGIFEQYQNSIQTMAVMQRGFLRQNVERIDKALSGLRLVRK